MYKDKKVYRGKWYEISTGWSGFSITYNFSGYDDDRPYLKIYLIWGHFFIYLPWKHYKKVERKKTTAELRYDKLQKLKNPNYIAKKVYKKVEYDDFEDSPIYGFYFYEKEFVINYGTKSKHFDLPWKWQWIRTSYLDKNNNWIEENKKTDILYSETHPYKYITTSNEIQECTATITVEEREWRWSWFRNITWIKFMKKIKKDINVEFSEDIGEKKGSWKGGVIGTNFNMLPDETPYDALKRMEKTRKFK